MTNRWITEWDGEMALEVVSLTDLGMNVKRGGASRRKIAEFADTNIFFSNIQKDGKAYQADVRRSVEDETAVGTYRLPVRWGEKAFANLQKLPPAKRDNVAVAARIELTPKGNPRIVDPK
jgi:hypothetical protein